MGAFNGGPIQADAAVMFYTLTAQAERNADVADEPTGTMLVHKQSEVV